MSRIDGGNWTVTKPDFLYTGVTIGTLQRVLGSRTIFSSRFSYDVIVTFSIM